MNKSYTDNPVLL